MKTPHILKQAALAVAMGLGLGASTAQAQIANDFIIDQFGDDSTLFQWSRAYGNVVPEFSWDAEANSTVSDNPMGALKIVLPFDLVTYQGDNQTCLQKPFGEIIDFAKYTHVHFDIKLDDSSSRLSTSWGAGQFGGINLIARNNDWSVQLDNITTGDPWLGAGAYGVWTHQSAEVDQTLSNHHELTTLMMQIWSGWVESGGVTGGHTNTVTLWLDNIYLEANTNNAPPPPPTVALSSATSGLYSIASQTGGQYQRQNIRTVSSSQSWVGATGPVTYELTIKEPPMKNGFQAHMFLIPNSTGDTAPDWNRPGALTLMIYDEANGAGRAALGYKTNEPSGNTQIYGSGHLVTVNSAAIVGTWKVTFTGDTEITLTAPDGTEGTASMPAESVAFFNNPVTAYFGTQPGNVDYVGSGYVFSGVKIAGTAEPIEDTFAGPDLNADLWVEASDDGPGVFIAPAESKYFLSWTLPANGFTPQVSPSLVPGAWTELAVAGSKIGPDMRVLLNSADLPTGNQAYFRMLQRGFKKLQVLLPGETAAPGTPTGKTGTPTEIYAGVAFDIVVNAVDDNWNLATIASDSVTISCSDTTAILPADARLVSGTKTFSVTIGTAGPFTVTATDVTDPTKTPGTSTEVTAQ